MVDIEIIKNLQGGDKECIKYLYVHLNIVESWVVKNQGSKEDAFDLFQEALIIFYKNVIAETYQHRSKISTYLLAICKNQWYTLLKKKQKHQSVYAASMIVEEVEQSELRLADFGLPSRGEYLNEAMDKLDDKCRSILEASIFLKLNMEQIAQKYGYANAHSARQQKLRCLKKLRSLVSYEYILSLD